MRGFRCRSCLYSGLRPPFPREKPLVPRVHSVLSTVKSHSLPLEQNHELILIVFKQIRITCQRKYCHPISLCENSILLKRIELQSKLPPTVNRMHIESGQGCLQPCHTQLAQTSKPRPGHGGEKNYKHPSEKQERSDKPSMRKVNRIRYISTDQLLFPARGESSRAFPNVVVPPPKKNRGSTLMAPSLRIYMYAS